VTAPTLRHALPFARIGFLNMLAYRARYYVGVLTYLFNVAVYYFIWRAVFSHSPTVVGLSLAEMTTYLAVGWTIRSFYFNEIDRDIAAQVQEPDPGEGERVAQRRRGHGALVRGRTSRTMSRTRYRSAGTRPNANGSGPQTSA